MKKKYRDKWVKRLKSGYYKQGSGSLLTEKDRFCCLGVLSNIVKKEVGGDWDTDNYFRLKNAEGKFIYAESEYEEDSGENEFLPRSVAELVGLKGHTNPHVDYKGETTTLADLNDKEVSFKEIAKIIEEQL